MWLLSRCCYLFPQNAEVLVQGWYNNAMRIFGLLWPKSQEFLAVWFGSMELAAYGSQTTWEVYAKLLVSEWLRNYPWVLYTFWDCPWSIHSRDWELLPLRWATYHKAPSLTFICIQGHLFPWPFLSSVIPKEPFCELDQFCELVT